MKICPECQAKIIDNSKFCVKCGFNIKKFEEENATSEYFCPDCGTKFSGGYFCPECGYNIRLDIVNNESDLDADDNLDNDDDIDNSDDNLDGVDKDIIDNLINSTLNLHGDALQGAIDYVNRTKEILETGGLDALMEFLNNNEDKH